VTPKVITNVKEMIADAEDLDGFDDLTPEAQDKVRKAWEVGHVADEDIPESARKGADEDDDDEEDGKKSKKKKKDAAPDKGVFKLEYASSSRSKCKVCSESIGKDFFRIGEEVDFRGNKTLKWSHWGCLTEATVALLKKSYGEPTEIDGFSTIKDGEQEKVKRAWEEGEIPEDDKGVGEAVEGVSKKAPAKRAKKADNEDGTPPKKRARRSKKNEDEDEEMDDEEEKPKKKRAPPAKKEKAPPKKRAPKKKKDEEDEESGEDFGEAIANVSGDDDEEEEEPAPKKSKRAAPKPSSSKPASKRSAKPSRGKKAAATSEEDYD